MDLHILEEIGFTKGEVATYNALLELGEATIGPISHRTRITPAKNYLILERLSNKGLITCTQRLGRKNYHALDPERLVDLLKRKNKEIKEQQRKLESLLPMLRKRHDTQARPQAYVYENIEGLRNLYDSILTDLHSRKEPFIGFAMQEYSQPHARTFFRNYDIKRSELGIRTLLLALSAQQKIFIQDTKKYRFMQVKYVSQALPAGVIIYANKVATIVWTTTPYAFVIESKSLAESYRKFFYALWKKTE
jgi:sugar-specific transcriptional regulator TrmB